MPYLRRGGTARQSHSLCGFQPSRPTALSNALAFLHRDFEPRAYYWEIAEVFKKLFLVGAAPRSEGPSRAATARYISCRAPTCRALLHLAALMPLPLVALQAS